MCKRTEEKEVGLRSGSHAIDKDNGFFNVPISNHLHEATLLKVIPGNRPISVAFFDTQGNTEDQFSF